MSQFWCRSTNKIEVEKIYGKFWIDLLYGTKLGRWFTQKFFIGKNFSQWMGDRESHPRSALKIPEFIKQYSIKMDEYEPGPYQTFNDFFIRKFKEGSRSFVNIPNTMPAFAEGRYLGYSEFQKETKLKIKQSILSVSSLIGRPEAAEPFVCGPVLIARLCPVDYHRFHFPDDGSILNQYRIQGKLHSVNPKALEAFPEIPLMNERQVTLLDTKNFGRLAYIEIGAMSVGKIIQTYNKRNFKRGDEKGYFLFGASCVVLVGEKDRWLPSSDILTYSNQGIETLVKLGEEVAIQKPTVKPPSTSRH